MQLGSDQDKPIEMYRGILDFLEESTDDYFFLWDYAQERLYLSPRIREEYALMENGREYVKIEDWCRLVYPRDLPALEAALERIARGEDTAHSMEYRLINRRGEIVWINCRGKSQLDEMGRPLWLVGRITNAPQERRADRLTGALNMESLKEEIEELLRTEQDGFLLLVGVDELKSINLKHGRSFGDRVLREVVQALEESVNGAWRIYRTNGDCFAVNLRETDEQGAEQVFRQTQTRMEGLCTLSGGCVAYRKYRVLDGETMYQYAENSLDYAKAQGRSVLWFFSAEDYERDLAALELRDDLRESVARDFSGFSLCYQPQVYSGSYGLYGAEALLRYTSPRRGPVSPLEFVPVLEQSGLICQVGLWVLRTALAQCSVWRRRMPDFHISINISYAQLCQEDVGEQVIQALKAAGLPGRALTIEVTESMQLFDYPHINGIFRRWKQYGVEISVDDFGTGYSGLRRLKELEVDEIKVDRCFVSNLQHSAYNYRLIGNILDLADSGRIRTCCEGVESEEELTVLEELGPTLLQGFLFSRPCTPAEFEATFLDEDAPAFQQRLARQRRYQSVSHPRSGLGKQTAEWPEQELVQAIMESENDIFYVSDPDTYELYYLNPAGKRLFGLRDYHGKKCYKVLQGRDEPCPFCTNALLKKDDFYIWDQFNEYCGRHFILKDKLMVHGGRRLRLEVALDVTKHEMVSQTMRERLDFADKVVEYTRILSDEPDVGRAVQKVLASVGEFYQADRAYLFQPDPERPDFWNNTFEWCDRNVAPQMENLQQVPPGPLGRWMERFGRDEPVTILNLDSLREESPEEWSILSAQGIQRLIAVPLREETRTVGFIGVDNPRYSIQDDSQARVLSYFLVNRLAQERNAQRFRALLQQNYRGILDGLHLGLWIIHLNQARDQGEMVADDTMLQVLGLKGSPTPAECFQFWYSRINDGYYHYVRQSLERMIQTKHVVQLEYTWRHPELGEVVVRCTGALASRDADGGVTLRGYHRIVSDIEQPRFLQEVHQREVFEFHELSHTIFFHTPRTLLAGEQARESRFPRCWIENEMVHPHFAEAFHALFTQVRLREDAGVMELQLKSKSGVYEWYKLTLRRLGREGQDADTVVAEVEPAGQERSMELEYIRVRRFYQALLSEAVAYAEIDLESGQLQSIGGLWKDYTQNYRENNMHFMEVLQEKLAPYLSQEELKRLEEYRTPERWQRLLARGELSRRFCYRRPVGDALWWVEMDIQIFREDVTRNVYALIRLKDVTAARERELAQEEAASRDPLTNIYNRTAFEREVKHYVAGAEEEVCGVLMLLDIDNFKRINDRQGHLEGDRALKRVSQLLLSTFRKQDIVGRLGGDEFLIFVKGKVDPELLKERLRMLLYAFQTQTDAAVTSSIGATFVHKTGFDYQAVLQRADQALYRSKKTGTNDFSFLER